MDGLDRLAPGRPATVPAVGRELASFATIGVVSTVAYAVLYTAAREVTSATIANLLALVVTAIGNTAANRRLTFGVAGRASLLRDHAAGLAALGVALAITTLAVLGLDAFRPNAGRGLELVVLLAANAVATVARFVLLRRWIGSRPAVLEA